MPVLSTMDFVGFVLAEPQIGCAPFVPDLKRAIAAEAISSADRIGTAVARQGVESGNQ